MRKWLHKNRTCKAFPQWRIPGGPGICISFSSIYKSGPIYDLGKSTELCRGICFLYRGRTIFVLDSFIFTVSTCNMYVILFEVYHE